VVRKAVGYVDRKQLRVIGSILWLSGETRMQYFVCSYVYELDRQVVLIASFIAITASYGHDPCSGLYPPF
jgi:hypothetical protein